MPKYNFIYTTCEGDYLMEVFTGFTFFAKNDIEAMYSAKHLDGIISSFYIFTVGFISQPDPHILVSCKKRKDQSLVNNVGVTAFKILDPNGTPEYMMGYPVYSNVDDYTEVSESEFIHSFTNNYKDYFRDNNKSYISFEPVAYGIEKMA